MSINIKKKWYKSKTIRTNAALLILSIVSFFGVVNISAEEQSAIVETVTGGSLTAGITAVVNIILRFATKEAITK